ncbi:MAG: hypothetical protein HYZ13_06995 [Acidobacteria bacterium]|nr:hypothetical protein [Acidobacteriota bacterium]
MEFESHPPINAFAGILNRIDAMGRAAWRAEASVPFGPSPALPSLSVP